MILYLIRSALCLLLLLTAYKLLLEKGKMFRFNRAYLLFSLIFSFIIPLIPLTTHFQSPTLNNAIPSLPVGISQLITPLQPTAGTAIHQTRSIPYTTILLIAYCLITLGFLIRFIRNLYQILSYIRNHEQIRLGKARLILVSEEIVSHTFYTNIFINETVYRNHALEQEVLIHELAHVKQRHSIDILFVETLQVFCWFNPLLFLYKWAIQLNHEFLADEAVIDTYKNPQHYQHLLLNKISQVAHLSLSSPLNYKITKKRLIMMTTTQNKKNILLRKMAIAPLMLGSIFLFSPPTNAQKNDPDSIVDQKLAKEITDIIEKSNRDAAIKAQKSPLVIIDGKQYSSDILTQISPACMKSSETRAGKTAIDKYGPKAANGVFIISTFKGIVYLTDTEKENQGKEHVASTGFYHRITLKKEDGSRYDKFFVNLPGRGAVNAAAEKDAKVAFLVGNKLFNEDQIGDVEKEVNAMTKAGEFGVGGNTVKKVPGLDLSSYQLVFYFNYP